MDQKMKLQTSNLKGLTAIHLAIQHFLPKIKSLNFKSILIPMNNTAAMFNINNMTTRKIWYLTDKNQMFLKAAHIPGKLNTTIDKLSRLEMSRDYCISKNRPICLQEKQTSTKICINDSNERPRQYRVQSDNDYFEMERSDFVNSDREFYDISILLVMQQWTQ
jgi:hypothetical protein